MDQQTQIIIDRLEVNKRLLLFDNSVFKKQIRELEQKLQESEEEKLKLLKELATERELKSREILELKRKQEQEIHDCICILRWEVRAGLI